jgi:hypothetical protein
LKSNKEKKALKNKMGSYKFIAGIKSNLLKSKATQPLTYNDMINLGIRKYEHQF